MSERTTNCPGCQKKFRFKAEHQGKGVRCPSCQTSFTIPKVAQTPVANQPVPIQEPPESQLTLYEEFANQLMGKGTIGKESGDYQTVNRRLHAQVQSSSVNLDATGFLYRGVFLALFGIFLFGFSLINLLWARSTGVLLVGGFVSAVACGLGALSILIGSGSRILFGLLWSVFPAAAGIGALAFLVMQVGIPSPESIQLADKTSSETEVPEPAQPRVDVPSATSVSKAPSPTPKASTPEALPRNQAAPPTDRTQSNATQPKMNPDSGVPRGFEPDDAFPSRQTITQRPSLPADPPGRNSLPANDATDVWIQEVEPDSARSRQRNANRTVKDANRPPPDPFNNQPIEEHWEDPDAIAIPGDHRKIHEWNVRENTLREKMREAFGPFYTRDLPGNQYSKLVGFDSPFKNKWMAGPKVPVLGLIGRLSIQNDNSFSILPVFDRDEESLIIAKEGYALGGLHVFAVSRAVVGLRPTFMRLKGKKLDADDSYQGKWLGLPGADDAPFIKSDGRLVIGLHICGAHRVEGISLIMEPKK